MDPLNEFIDRHKLSPQEEFECERLKNFYFKWGLGNLAAEFDQLPFPWTKRRLLRLHRIRLKSEWLYRVALRIPLITPPDWWYRLKLKKFIRERQR
jgi:hypothetical protein